MAQERRERENPKRHWGEAGRSQSAALPRRLASLRMEWPIFWSICAGIVGGVVVEAISGIGKRMFERVFPPPPQRVELVDSRPPVDWLIEWQSGSLYRLRNVGREKAVNVRIDPASLEGLLFRYLPDGIDLGAGESRDFLVGGTTDRSSPGEVWVSWNGPDSPAAVSMPTQG